MTWIVGVNSITSCSILVSDVQVTFTSQQGIRNYRDCLQKIYPLGNYLIGGFAGSVKIGFAVIERLKHELTTNSDEHFWDLEVIGNTWLRRTIRRAYKLSDEREKRSGCQIIIAGTNARKPAGNSHPLHGEVFSFSSPDFHPIRARAGNPLEIGCGSLIPSLGKELTDLVSDIGFHKASMAGVGAQGQIIGHFFHDKLTQSPVAGISKFTQVGIARPGELQIFDYGFKEYPAGGPPIAHSVPPVARSYPEFCAYCDLIGEAAAAATC